MPLQMQFDPADLRRLTRAMDRLGEHDLMQGALKRIGQQIRAEAGKYPPPLPRNPTGWWWERGWGWWIGGVKQEKTSDDMKSKWYVKAFPAYVEIGNLAKYAGYVHGDVQLAVHQAHGWKKLYDVAVDSMPRLVEEAKVQIRKIWEARI